MELSPKFKIVYTEEAINFLRSLPLKAKAKVVYNIGKSMYVLDNSLFKNLKILIFGSSEPCIMELLTDFLHSGIQKKTL